MRSSAKRPAPPSAWSWIERGMVEMSKINKALDYIEEVLVCLCLIAMTALTFGNAVLRKLGSGISFSEEISTYLFVLLSLLGSAIAAKRGAHLGLTLVTERVGAKAARILGIISMIFSTAFSALICYYGVFMAINPAPRVHLRLLRPHRRAVHYDTLRAEPVQAHRRQGDSQGGRRGRRSGGREGRGE